LGVLCHFEPRLKELFLERKTKVTTSTREITVCPNLGPYRKHQQLGEKARRSPVFKAHLLTGILGRFETAKGFYGAASGVPLKWCYSRVLLKKPRRNSATGCLAAFVGENLGKSVYPPLMKTNQGFSMLAETRSRQRFWISLVRTGEGNGSGVGAVHRGR